MAREFTAVDDLVQHQATLEIIDKGVPQHLALLTRNVHVGRQHVLDGGGAGDQIVGLEDHADLAAIAAHGPALEGHDVGAVHDELAAGHVDHAVDGADQGGFACAGQADDGHKFALVNGQVDILQALDAVGIYLIYMLKLDQNNRLLPARGRVIKYPAAGKSCRAVCP